MKFALFILSLATSVVASPAAQLEERQASTGDGPYAPAGYQTISSLGSHTIYRPNNAAAAGAMPVVIWGNGGCGADGTSAANFLTQIASYGFLVIASGSPGGSGSTTVQMMEDSIRWAVSGAGGSFNVNTAKIMVAGYSCGGTEAYNFQSDSRITTIGIFSSGYLSNYDAARQIKKPIMFALGGPNDIAYGNGERDYSYLPSGTPSWKGNLNRVGHGGTYSEFNGGLFAKAAYKWALWLLKGDASAAAYFQGNAAVQDGWNDAVSKSLNLIGSNPGGTPTTTSGGSTPTTSGSSTTTTSNPGGGNNGGGCSALYGQCAGNGWTGPKCCSQGICKYSNDWYSQCL